MKLEVHFEAVYDKWRKHECPPGHQNEVVAKRASLPAERADSLEELFARQANNIFAADPLSARGYHHRVRILGIKVDGGQFNPEQQMYIPVKISQTA